MGVHVGDCTNDAPWLQLLKVQREGRLIFFLFISAWDPHISLCIVEGQNTGFAFSRHQQIKSYIKIKPALCPIFQVFTTLIKHLIYLFFALCTKHT